MTGSRRKANISTRGRRDTRGNNTSIFNRAKKDKSTSGTSKSVQKSTLSSQNTQKLKVNTKKSTLTSQNTPKSTVNTQKKTNTHQGTFGNRRKQMTAQAQKTQEKYAAKVTDTAKRSKQLMQGALQQSAGSYRKAVAGTVSNSMGDKKNTRGTGGIAARRGSQGVSRRGSNDRNIRNDRSLSKEQQKQNADRVNRIRESQKKGAERSSELASKQIDRGAKNIEKGKEGLGKGGKYAADLLVGGTQLASDIGIGMATGGSALPATFARAFGGGMDSAEKEGASGKQTMMYGLASAGLETATEKLGNIAAPLKKAYGKGIADDFMDKVVGKMSKQGSKNLAYHGGKTLMAAVTEGLEEMIAEGLDPAIANSIYASSLYEEKNNEVRSEIDKQYDAARTQLADQISTLGLSPEESEQLYNHYLNEFELTDSHREADYAEYAIENPHKFSLKDTLYAGAVGAGLGGILGGGGQIVEYNKGKNISDNATEYFGEGGIKELFDKGIDIDEDAGGGTRAEALKEMATSGGGVAYGQVAEMAQAVQEQEIRDENRFSDANNAANREIEKQNLDNIMVVGRNKETGEVEVDLTENAQGIFDANKESNIKAIGQAREKLQLPEMTDEQVTGIAEAIAGIQTGIVTMDDISLFTLRNPENRAMFEAATGVKLPETNQETKTMLLEMMAEGRLNSAKSETAKRKDTVRGMLLQDIAPGYGSAGQSVIINNVDTINADSIDDTDMYLMGFDNAYNSGRAGWSYDEFESEFKAVTGNVPEGVLRAAYDAGIEDRTTVLQTAEKVQLKLGQKAEKNRSKKGSGSQRGKLSVNLAPENKGKFGAQEQIFYKAIARALNIEIRIVDNLGANGTYVDGIVTMDVLHRDRALEYTFMHEITHHLQDYAPQEYQKLKEFLRNAWMKKDPDGFRAALDAKRAQYAESGVKLNDEAAFDEIIADGTYEFLQDENFINELCTKEHGVAQALLDAIRKLIDKIRAILVDGDRFTPKQNEALYSNLDILKEMESLWADALAKAVENRDAVGTVSETESVAKHSLMEFEDGKRFVQIDGDTSMFDGLSEREQGALATKIIKEKFSGKVIGLDNKVYVNGRGAGEYGFPVKKLGVAEHDAKMRASSELDNIVDAGFNFRNEPDGKDGHVHEDVVNGFDYFDVIFKLGDKYFQGVINIKNVKSGKLFKDLTKIKDVTKDISSSYGKNPKSTFLRTSSMEIITDHTENGKAKMSLPDTDSTGRELSEGQQEYFAESKVRDEEGKLIPMYHGTPNGDYDAFRQGTYFTPNKDYADVYQAQGASSLGYKKTANKPDTYEVYLNIKKPFDTRNPEERRIFEEEFYRQWGTGTPLMDSGLPDWLDGEDLIEFLEEMGYDYDGLILDEGGVGGYGDEVVSRGFSYVILNPNQAKSVDNENPTDDPRMRFSLPDYGKKEYNHHGWVTANNLMSKEEMAVYQKQVADHERGDFYQIRDGLYVIPTGENGLRNVLVFTDGDWEHPSIDKLIRINSANGSEIDLYTEDIVYEEQHGIRETLATYEREGIYTSFEVRGYRFAEWKRRRETETSKTIYFDSEDEQDGGGSYAESERDIEKVRWSLSDSDDIYDYINSNETEFVDVPPTRDYEKERARVKDQSVGELKKQVEKLQSQTKLTHGKVLDPKSVAEEINMLVKSLLAYNDGTKKTDHKLIKTVQENAKSIYTDIKNGNIEDAAITALNVATEVVENLELVNDEMYQEYKELRSYLKQTKIRLPEGFLHRKEFRAENFGRLVLVNEGGRDVDDVYGDLVAAFPGMFDETLVTEEDMLQEIADVRASLEPYDIVLSEEETNQLIKETAHDILDIAVHGKPWKSWADRQKEIYDKRTKKLKARHKEALRDVRAKINEKVKARVEGEKMAVAREQAKKKRTQQESKARRDSETEKRRHISRIEKDLKWLSDRLLKPTDDKHLPDGYQKAIAELLVMADPQTARSKKLEEKYGISKKRANFLKLKAEYENIAKTEAEGMIYNEDISNWCEQLGQTLDDAGSIADATVEEMRVIRQLIRAIAHGIREQNKAFDENLKAGIAELATETIHKAKTSRKTGQRSGLPGALGTLLNESMVTPRDFFEGIGGGLHKAFMSIRKGEDKHIDNMTEAREFFAELFGKYANKKKPGSAIEQWRDHHTNKTFKLEGGTITMNTAQIMSLYCLRKRKQAAGHIFESGIVVAEASTKTKLKEALGAKKEINYGTTRITMEEAYEIIGTLSPEQIEIADKLQEFLNGTCAEWGNETSLKMFGYKKFTEKNYFPIKSADVYLDSNFEGRQQVERIRNFGFTKGTVVNANNPIVIDDIFTVVADHVNKMSMYNAFAAPIADFTRVYNFKSRDADGRIIESAKDALANAYGKKVGRYINNFIADLQSNTQTRQEGFTRFVNKTLANYKKATIAANVRVAFQQPTAIIRAFTALDPKYFILKNHTPELLKKAKGEDTDYKDMLKHCPIARWKSWGFSQVDMARDIDDIMMNKEWSKLDLVTMQVYGVLDLYTWSKIWGAVRAETKVKHPDVEVDSEEFYAICNERASEVFDKTQVVDSVIHRSQVMRNTDTMSKILTSFMAEPTRTYNMVRSEYAQAVDMWISGDKTKASAKVARASSVYLFNALACAAAAAVADALRGKDLDDDDEPEEWWELTLSNFMSGANPLNLLPVFKEVTSIWKGWDTSNMALEGIEALVKAEKGLFDKMMGNSDKTWGELFRKQAEAIGLVFGVPVKNILREIESFGKMVGIDVFAAEAGEEEKTQDLKLITDGSGFDNFLNAVGINLSDKEKMDRNFDKTVKSLNKATKNMSEKEKQEYLWKEITANYTNEIKAGNYDVLDNMSRLLEATGGDYKKFEESVISRTKTEMKKSIGADSAMTDMYREQLKGFGMTDAKINQEVVMKSDTAKEFKVAACEDDLDGMTQTIVELYMAGLSEEEVDILYMNRASAVSGGDYSTGELASPVSGEITSSFGYRNSPGGIGSTNHKGIDIAVSANTDVAAADGGEVEYVGYDNSRGYYVRVNHGNGRKTEYLHLNGYYVQKGDVVVKGQTIALSGSTGASTGPHLHFAVKEGSTYVDPLPYLQ